MQMNIMFSSVGRRVELIEQFRQAAKDTGTELKIFGTDMNIRTAAAYFCDEALEVPRIADPAYIPTLLQYCEQYRIDLLIPTIDTDLLLLSENVQAFRQIGTTVLISRPDKIRLSMDKRLTGEYFQSLGLSAPETVDDVRKYNGPFPAFIKPTCGSASIGADKADDADQLREYAEKLTDYVVQPFVDGTEYTIDIFCDLDGNPVYITPRVRLAVRAGEVLITEIRRDDSMIKEMQTLIRDYRPCGPITVQLIKETATGKNHYIEINPRFGGGAPLSMKAGADAAKALLLLMKGDKIAYQENAARDGERYCRYDQSVKV